MKLNKATKKKNESFIYRERKERVVKPKNVLPDAFYTSSRKGYAWCDQCKGNEINVLNRLVLTCAQGHTRTILGLDYKMPSNAALVADRKADSLIKKSTPIMFMI